MWLWDDIAAEHRLDTVVACIRHSLAALIGMRQFQNPAAEVQTLPSPFRI